MKKIDVANGLIFREMNINKESFDDRLICQKKIYLLQSLGTDLGYSYNWYVRGPYSPMLSNYVYNNFDVLKSENFEKHKLGKPVKERVDKVNNLSDKKPSEMTAASWYELLASLIYIYNNKRSWKINDEKNSLYDALISHKPQYSQEQCENAYNILKTMSFIGDAN